MNEPSTGGLPEGTPEFADPYLDLAVEGSARADTLSFIMIGVFALILVLGVLNLIWLSRSAR